jgi:uncharacterized membrane protein (UPF0127 family)
VVKLADNEEERSQGLSGKKFLLPHFAMFFILENEDKVGIWI